MKSSRSLPVMFFTLVALLSFSIWAAGSRIYRTEAGLYTLCALVFLGLGGPALLPGSGIHGARAVASFTGRFALGFTLYALLWSAAWFTFRGTFGEVAGSFTGLLVLVACLRRTDARRGSLVAEMAPVFLWHTLGYYTGGLLYEVLQDRGPFGLELPLGGGTVVMLARFAWGLCYGLGFGIGLSGLVQPPRR